MPGLVGYASVEEALTPGILPRMARTLMHGPYKLTEATYSKCALACIHHGLFDHSITASTPEGVVRVMLDGWLFGWQGALGATDAANYCLELYLREGVRFAKRLNGQFNLAIWDDRSASAYLINDRYGTRPLQYAVFGGALYFAPEAKAILAGSGMTPRLNMEMVTNQLSWGRMWIGDETFFKNVKVLSPSSILHWERGKATIERYWDYQYCESTSTTEDLVQETVAVFRSAMRRQAGGIQSFGVSLSGGLDSRVLATGLTQVGVKNLRCYTWGISAANDEITIAQQVARALKMPWKFVSLTPTDFVRNAARGIFLSEGMDLFVQSYGLTSYPAIASDTSVLLTGIALDLTLGGSYLNPSLTSGKITSDDAFELALKRSTYFSEDECISMMQPMGVREGLLRLRAVASSLWQEGNVVHPADRCDRFFLHTRVWRNIFFRQMWQRLFLEDISPTFDNELVECLLRIPPDLRVEHRFYQKFLAALSPEMSRITYQRTMLPASAPVEFWPAAAQLEQQQEKLYRDIWHATDGRVFVPYTRFYTNFDEWLRLDPDWVKLTNNLLLNAESRVCATLVHKKYVEQLVADHRSAKGSHYQKIIQLMGLELMMRQFFDS